MMEIRQMKRLEEEDVRTLNRLVDLCVESDGIEYKPCIEDDGLPEGLPVAFLAFECGELAGFVHIFHAPQDYPEIIGFVHPSHRRKGIFSNLYRQAVDALGGAEHLLVTGRSWHGGAGFAKKHGMGRLHSEYVMVYSSNEWNGGLLQTEQWDVRDAKIDDIPSMALLAKECYGSFSIEKEVDHLKKALEAKDTKLLMVEQSGKAVGMAALYGEKMRIGIFGVCVSPDFRKRGIGGMLIEASVEAARHMGGNREIYLEVQTDNMGALSIYEKRGFRQTEVFDYYIGRG